MTYIKKLDKLIFLAMCGFALSFGINGFIADQFTGVAVFLAILRTLKSRPAITIPKEYARALYVFFCGFFILIFFSSEIAVSAKEYWRHFNRIFPFLLVAIFVKDSKKIVVLFVLIFVSLFINNLYAIYQGIDLVLAKVLYIRVTGIDIDIIGLAGYLLIILPILLILMFEKQVMNYRIYIMGAFIVGVIALLLNGSRMAWLIIAIVVPSILFIYMHDLKKVITILLATLICGGVIVASMPFLTERVKSFTNTENVSNRGHYFITQDTLHMIGDYPLLGVGLGRFQKVYNAEYISSDTKLVEPYVTHAHNNTLVVVAQTGIIGGIIFWFMFGSFLYYSGKSWFKSKQSKDLMFFMITLGTVLQGITDYSFGLHQVMKLYFFMLALYLNYRSDDKVGIGR